MSEKGLSQGWVWRELISKRTSRLLCVLLPYNADSSLWLRKTMCRMAFPLQRQVIFAVELGVPVHFEGWNREIAWGMGCIAGEKVYDCTMLAHR